MAAFLKFSITRSISAILIVCIAALNIPLPVFAGGDSAAEELKQIQYKYYFRGRYSEAIDVLQTFLARTDVPKNVEINAREFLAASFILSGSPDKGQDQFLHLLSENDGYAGPDAALFKPEVMDAFNSTRDTYLAVKLRTVPETERDQASPVTAATGESKPIYKKWWFYVGLAAVVVIAAAAASPKEDETTAPAAPTGTVSVGVSIQ